MKNPELFDLTIGILVKAYLNDELEATDCAACLVGNLVCAGMGYKHSSINRYRTKIGEIVTTAWSKIRYLGGDKSIIRIENYDGLCKEQIDSTGYSPEQVVLLENAFMNGLYDDNSMDEMNYYGLMAAVDCLMLIHEANEQEIQEAKELFVK